MIEFHLINPYEKNFYGLHVSASVPENVMTFPLLPGSNDQTPPKILKLLFHVIVPHTPLLHHLPTCPVIQMVKNRP